MLTHKDKKNKCKIKLIKINVSYDLHTYNLLINNLTNLEKHHINRYKQFKDRYNSLIATSILKSLIIQEGFPPKELLRTEEGKPFFEKYTGHISISHIEGYVVVALAEEKVGLDIERIITTVDKDFFMSNKELQLHKHVKVFTEEELTTFIWTLKEAYLKCKGTGFLIDPTDFTFSYTNNTWVLENEEIYSFTDKSKEGYILSLISEKPFELDYKTIDDQTMIVRCS